MKGGKGKDGRGRISAARPTLLRRENPEIATAAHRRSGREWRRSIFLPLTVILLSLGTLFFVLPTFTAYVFGVLCGWLALSAWREAFRRRGER